MTPPLLFSQQVEAQALEAAKFAQLSDHRPIVPALTGVLFLTAALFAYIHEQQPNHTPYVLDQA